MSRYSEQELEKLRRELTQAKQMAGGMQQQLMAERQNRSQQANMYVNQFYHATAQKLFVDVINSDDYESDTEIPNIAKWAAESAHELCVALKMVKPIEETDDVPSDTTSEGDDSPPEDEGGPDAGRGDEEAEGSRIITG